MKQFIAILTFCSFLYGGLALAVPRYFVEDSSSVVKSYTIDDAFPTPVGHTAVNASVIEAAYTGIIYQGGTWVAATSTYTPPTGIVTEIDDSTDQGGVQVAAHDMMDVLENGLAYIDANKHVWTAAGVARAKDGIHWMMINSARVALNTTRTHANRQKFLEEAASWPTGVNGNAREYTDAVAALDIDLSKDWSWVDVSEINIPRIAVSNSNTGFVDAVNVEDAPTSDALVGRGWINSIL